MRKMYTTKRLLGLATCAAIGLSILAPATAQDAPELVQEQELFQDDKPDEKGNQVAVGETGEIELHVKELEITKVLQLLSIQSQRNIIASRGVENAKVSADLYGVSFEDALKAILEPNGFGYVEEGNFIYVLTKEELAERENINRKLTTKIMRLDYLRAEEAAGFVTPMLSDRGAITASGTVDAGIDPGLDDAGADNYSGPPTLVIRDYEDSVEEITAVLKELDIQPKQVIIEATVLQAQLSENNQFGVDFSLFSDLSGTSPLDIVDGVISGGAPGGNRFIGGETNLISDSQLANAGVKLGFVAGDASVFVTALDSVTDTTVIATPKVTVLDRNKTSILVGRKVAYLSTTVTETSETQTVEFLEVGTQLNVRPFVASDGKIRLELRPSVSDATIRTVGSTDVPDETTAEIVTNVIVDSGQTIVLGGLFTDDTSVNRNQFPGLGNVPIIGKAFQSQGDTVDRSEVIFMVKATVDESNTLANRLGDEATERVNVARLAERNSLLPWSRDKLTAAHLVNARKHYDEAQSLTGEARDKKMAEARFCVDMALHMNPSMVDALRLKEKITGEVAYIPYEESIVTQTYDKVLDKEMKDLGVPVLPEPEAKIDEVIIPEMLGEAEPTAEPNADQELLEAEFAAEPAAETPAEPASEEAQAEADAAWLEKMLAEQFEEGQAPAEQAAEATEEPATEPTDEATEEATPSVAEAETEAEPTPAEETTVEETTAELLEEVIEVPAEEATEEAQADANTDGTETTPEADPETDNSTANVETQTD